MKRKKIALLLTTLLIGNLVLTACNTAQTDSDSSSFENEDTFTSMDELSDTDFDFSSDDEVSVSQDGALYDGMGMDVFEYEEGCDNLNGKVISITAYDMLDPALLLTSDNKVYSLNFDETTYLFDTVTDATKLLDKTVECNVLTLNKDGSYTLYNEKDSSQNHTFTTDHLMCAYTDCGYFTYFSLEDSYLQIVSHEQNEAAPAAVPVQFNKAPLLGKSSDDKVLTHEPIKNAVISTYCIDILESNGEEYTARIELAGHSANKNGTVDFNTHPGHPYLKNVDEIYGSGIEYSSPIFSVIDDPENLYTYEFDILFSEETELLTMPMPEGYTTADIKQIYENDDILLCLTDGSVFFRDSAEPDYEWEFLEKVTELNKEGHIIDFAISYDILALCDDMYLYELD